jgi:membrane protease YdiL (CAAX protease family)
VPVLVLGSLIGAVIGLPFVDDLEQVTNVGDMVDDSAGLPLVVLVPSTLGQQLAQGGWPLLVSRWKGLGPVADWRLRFSPTDLVIGLLTAMMALGLVAVMSSAVGAVVGLGDQSEAENTQFLSDATGTVWIYPLLAAVVIIAPVVEELFFRGLVLRAIEKRAGPVVAVIGSTLAFTLPHFNGSTAAGTAVLLASIGTIGAVLATVTVLVDRLWPAVMAHMLFNAFGAAGALGAFDRFTGS